MATQDEPSLSELVTGAVHDVKTLITGQVELVKAEVSASAKRGVTGAVLIGLAVFLALFALLMLAFSAAYGLVAAGLDPWAAFLIVGGVMLLVTAIVVFLAIREFKKVRGPVLAQEELAKTKAALSGVAADTATEVADGVKTTAKSARDKVQGASTTESTTVFPSYGGTPPSP